MTEIDKAGEETMRFMRGKYALDERGQGDVMDRENLYRRRCF